MDNILDNNYRCSLCQYVPSVQTVSHSGTHVDSNQLNKVHSGRKIIACTRYRPTPRQTFSVYKRFRCLEKKHCAKYKALEKL